MYWIFVLREEETGPYAAEGTEFLTMLSGSKKRAKTA